MCIFIHCIFLYIYIYMPAYTCTYTQHVHRHCVQTCSCMSCILITCVFYVQKVKTQVQRRLIAVSVSCFWLTPALLVVPNVRRVATLWGPNLPSTKVWYLETLTGSDNLPIHPMMLRLFRLVKLSRVAPWLQSLCYATIQRVSIGNMNMETPTLWSNFRIFAKIFTCFYQTIFANVAFIGIGVMIYSHFRCSTAP